jgi:hypothetical protein
MWTDAADDDRMFALGRRFRRDLAPYATGQAYVNFTGDEGADRVRAGFVPGAYERLLELKAQWDPDGVFRGRL